MDVVLGEVDQPLRELLDLVGVTDWLEAGDATPTPRPARLSKVALKRKKLTFRLSKRATVTGSVKRRGKTVRRVTKAGRKGANTVRFKRKLKAGRYEVRLKPRGEIIAKPGPLVPLLPWLDPEFGAQAGRIEVALFA